MHTYLFEASNGFNWGRFMVGILDEEWQWESAAEPGELVINRMKWGQNSIWVADLVTGEAMWYRHGGGPAKYELEKHRIWVCPLFEPFLDWLNQQKREQIPELARTVVQLPDAIPAIYGYRREGTVAEPS